MEATGAAQAAQAAETDGIAHRRMPWAHAHRCPKWRRWVDQRRVCLDYAMRELGRGASQQIRAEERGPMPLCDASAARMSQYGSMSQSTTCCSRHTFNTAHAHMHMHMQLHAAWP